MKRFKTFFMSVIMLSMAAAQADYSPVPLYWKTLRLNEKEIYLFAYLTQVYDTHKSLINEQGRGDFTKWYYENRAELSYNIFDVLDTTDVVKFVGWVDDFYSQPEYHERPFPEALEYAYERSQMKEQTLLERYESLLGRDKKRPN